MLRDLNTLISDTRWWLKSGRDINNGGQIMGYGVYNGKDRSFVLTPR